jgi:alpha-beta hydrolase superfamily lysophospholipase
MKILHEEGAVTQRAVAGPSLYFTTAIPDAPLRAMVGILHGYADHGARYAHVMDEWAERGIGSVAIDMRGHGRAAGTRGFANRFEEFLDDAAELARLLAERANGAPLFLFGHSFGGLVASASVLESARSWRGLLLTSPFFGLALEVPALKLMAGRLASRVVPQLALPSGMSGAQMTHDPARAREYDQDPLVFREATARWFTETTAAQERTLARANELSLPVYIAASPTDPVASTAAAKKFFERVGSRDKTWDERQNLFHEILNEPEWQSIAAAMADWMLLHAEARSVRPPAA